MSADKFEDELIVIRKSASVSINVTRQSALIECKIKSKLSDTKYFFKDIRSGCFARTYRIRYLLFSYFLFFIIFCFSREREKKHSSDTEISQQKFDYSKLIIASEYANEALFATNCALERVYCIENYGYYCFQEYLVT